jgi:4'-phosphopantetheinyl transferase
MNSNCNTQLKLVPLLNSDEVHIWSACLPDHAKDVSYFTSILSEDESQKADSFKFFMDQTNFIVSRGILRCLLGSYLGQDPQQIEIIYGLWGKPCLITRHLYFNLSHSRNYILYAVTCNYEVGIDLEYIDKTFEIEDMALNILSPHELIYWKNVKPEEKVNTFFKLWVCKEAYLKASGKGWLSDQQEIPLMGLSFLKNDHNPSKVNEKITSPYCFESIPGYASALFIEGPFLRPLHYIWNP